MSAINTVVRSVRAPLQAIARRQYSSTVANAAAESTPTIAAPAVGHSNQRLAVAAGVSFVAGIDVTYAYYNCVIPFTSRGVLCVNTDIELHQYPPPLLTLYM